MTRRMCGCEGNLQNVHVCMLGAKQCCLFQDHYSLQSLCFYGKIESGRIINIQVPESFASGAMYQKNTMLCIPVFLQ